MKHLPTDRYRGGHAFVETRTGAYYGRLGYFAGLGHSSVRIAEEMGDRINPSTVRKMLSRWGIPQQRLWCQVPLTRMQRATLIWRAERAGMAPEEWLAQIVAAIL